METIEKDNDKSRSVYLMHKYDYKSLLKFLIYGGSIDSVQSINIDNVKKIKLLGTGAHGNVYLTEYNGQKYALKMEHIIENDENDDLSSPYLREIKFCKDVANKNPEFFMQMYGHDILDNCNEHKTKKQKTRGNEKYHKFIEKKCARKLYSYVDGIVNMEHILSDKKYVYSFVIQMANIVNIMQSNGYVHNDFYYKNVGYNKTDENILHLDINGTKFDVPLFGEKYVAIDYGNVLHEDFIMNDYEKKRYYSRIGKELDFVFFGYFFPVTVSVSQFRRNPEPYEKELLSSHNYENVRNITTNKYYQIILNLALNNRVYTKDVLPYDDVLYYIKNSSNIPKIVDYFNDKLIKLCTLFNM